MPPEEVKQQPTRSGAATIAAGIFASRILGFVRESVVAYFFGVSAYSSVYRAAMRGSNVIQNLLGEGTLSAAFIPIYSRLLEEGREEEAGRFAGAILGLLIAVVLAFIVLGILLAEPLTMILTPGFLNDAAEVAAGRLPVNRFDLSVAAVRIVFPATGIMVLSAWALGVLNSHRRFFLPYFAPVFNSIALIGVLFGAAYVLYGNVLTEGGPELLSPEQLTNLLFAAFVGSLVGAILMFVMQLPLVFKLLRGFRLSFSRDVPGVREAIGAFGPVVAGRGVYQFSGWLDLMLASFLRSAGGLAAIGFAQILYQLPVSLFGLSVAASELPELARMREEDSDQFVSRINRSVRQMCFMTVPTVIGYLAFGLLIVSTLFGRGEFSMEDAWLVYAVLGAYSLGILATTMGRLLQNAFYAIKDTRTPAKIAVVRVVVSTVVAVPLMIFLDQFILADVFGLATSGVGEMLRLGAVGLTLGPSAAAWVELFLLRRALKRQIVRFDLPWRSILKMTGLALLAAIPGAVLWFVLSSWNVIVLTLVVVGVFGGTYLAIAYVTRAPELDAWAGRFLRRFRRK